MSATAIMATTPTTPRPGARRPLPAARPGTPSVDVVLVGTLLEPAAMRVHPVTGAPEVTVLLAQPGLPPLRATLTYPPGQAAQVVAASKAHHLRTGTAVQLRGSGLSWRPRMGALHLDHVTSLQPLLQPHCPAMAAANDTQELTSG